MSLEPNFDQVMEEGAFERAIFVTDPGQTGIRLDHFLVSRLSRVSRSRIKAAIEAGLIKVEQQPCKPNQKVKPNQKIEVILPGISDDFDIVPEELSLHIVYEDDHLLVLYKEPGMVVHPAPGNYQGTLINGLAWYFQQQGILQPAGNKYRLGLVHRIDKETSGLLLIAKDEFAHAHLAKQFLEHTIDREYVALVWGEPDPKSGIIECNIGRDPRDRKRMAVFPEGLEGKQAITQYELVESFYYVSLVKCKLKTGRTHQIRVHMKYIGHPLFNDERYGGDQILKGTVFSKYRQFIQNCFKIMPRFALHARSLGFLHPYTGKKMHFERDVPDDFKALIYKWREYSKYRKDLISKENDGL